MQKPRQLRLAVLGATMAILFAQGVATTLLVARTRATAIATASETVARSARSVEAAINRSFAQMDAMLAGLPALLAPFAEADGARLDTDRANRVLAGLNDQGFLYRDILLAGPDGMPVAGALAISRRHPLPLPLRNGFTEIANRGGDPVAIGGPVQNSATGEWSLFFARPLSVAGLGPVTGVAEVPVPLVQALLGLGGGMPGLRITLERRDGTLLASLPHDETHLGKRLRPALGSVPASQDGGVDEVADPLTGAPVLAAARPTIFPALSVTATEEVGAALAAWRRDRERVLIVSGALAILIATLALALSVALGQRERVEAERTRFRRMLESALESMSEGFVMFDAEDRLVACNSRYKEFYRISAPFIRPGARFEDIIREGARHGQYPQAGEDIEAFTAQITAWHRGDNPPLERLLPDGRWVLITERRTADGGTVGIRTDITALRRTMQELAAARDAAAAAGEAKSQFLVRMSHELRTPLNGVLGFAQVLLQDRRLAPDQIEQVRTLHEAGRHLLDLVNGLLDLSKIEAGRFDMHPREMALRPLLEGCAALLRPEVDRKGIGFVLDAPADLPALVEGDPTRLRQLLLNLLSNAVKFTPSGGRVTLRARRMPAAPGPEGLRIEVADSGPGVPPGKRHMLFEEFVQLGQEGGGAEAAGTGLGLAISARLVALMGGRIGCDGGPGQEGALFWVELPLREVAAAPGLAPDRPAAPNRPAVPAEAAVPGRPMPGGPMPGAHVAPTIPSVAAPPPTAAWPGAVGARPLPGTPAAGPGAVAPAPSGDGAIARPTAGVGLSVLVVDDVAANRLVARAMLEVTGHRVELAADGAEAVAAAEHRGPFDIVLMDMQMPGMDGLEATRRIRALPGPRGRVPIVALTASALPGHVEACRAAGMDGHLAKPIDRNALAAALGLVTPRSPATRAEGPAPAAPIAPSGESEAVDPPLLDQATFGALARDLGPSAHGILGEFADEIRRALVVVTDAAAAEGADQEALRRGAHRLLGAAQTLGARRLAGLAERLQRAAAAKEPEVTATLHPQVVTVARATLTVLGARPELREAAAAGEEDAASACSSPPPSPVPQRA